MTATFHRLAAWMVTIVLCTIAVSASAQVEATAKLPAHPRLLMSAGDEDSLLIHIQASPNWAGVHKTIITEADKLLGKEPQAYKLVGKSLLGVSREYLRRIFFLSYAYRMTGERQYAEQARREMASAAAFTDWHPAHFLDVAEMTTAMAIGYDWLYDQLPRDERNTIGRAIIDKGLQPSLEAANVKQFDTRTNNWNQVCHAGLVMGALAVWESSSQLATMVVNRAIEHVPLAMKSYAPDGVYPEGSNYWNYGTNFNVLLLDALERCFGSDFGLSQAPGYMLTGSYYMNMLTPSAHNFCYSDNGISSTTDVAPAIFWLAHKTGDASVLYSERVAMNRLGYARVKDNRLAPAILIWGAHTDWKAIPMPEKLFFYGGGNAVATMRSAWDKQNAMFLGVKLGRAAEPHGHMDVGSFFIDWNYVTWATDLGSENYVTLDRNKVNQWNMSQTSPRWNVYRYNANNHNLVTFGRENPLVAPTITATEWSDDPDNQWVKADLAPLYRTQVNSYERTYALVDKSRCVITDQVTASGATTLWWNMMTPVQQVTQVDKNTLKLEERGKVMWLRIDTDLKIKWEITDAVPPTSYENKNKGVKAVRFHAPMKAGRRYTITATFSPQAP